jgi:hypothetical protein
MDHLIDFEVLERWRRIAEQIKALSEEELRLRKQLAASVVPPTEEATRTVELMEGWRLSVQQGMTRNLDANALDATIAQLQQWGVDVDALLPIKRSLSLAAYRKLDGEARMAIDRIITTKPSTPQVKILPPA